MSSSMFEFFINVIKYVGDSYLARLEFERRLRMYSDELNKIGQTIVEVLSEFYKINKFFLLPKNRKEFLWDVIALSTALAKIMVEYGSSISYLDVPLTTTTTSNTIGGSIKYIEPSIFVSTKVVGGVLFRLYDNVYSILPIANLKKQKFQVYINFYAVFDEIAEKEHALAEELNKKPESFGKAFRRALFSFLTVPKDFDVHTRPLPDNKLMYMAYRVRVAGLPRNNNEFGNFSKSYSDKSVTIKVFFENVRKRYAEKLFEIINAIPWHDIALSALEIENDKRSKFVQEKLRELLMEREITMFCCEPDKIIRKDKCFEKYCFISVNEDVYGIRVYISKTLLSRKPQVVIIVNDIENVMLECKAAYHEALNNAIMASVLNLLKELPQDFIIRYDDVSPAKDEIVEDTGALIIAFLEPIKK